MSMLDGPGGARAECGPAIDAWLADKDVLGI
jgi:hypothetical protein